MSRVARTDHDQVAMARAAALLYGFGACVVLGSVALPHWRHMNESGVAAPAIVALAVLVPLVTFPRRIPGWAFHALPIFGTSLITIAVRFAGGEAASATMATLYVFVTIYAFWFFSWREAQLHLAWVGVAYGVMLTQLNQTARAAHWLFAIGISAGAGTVVAILVDKRERVEEALASNEESFRLLFANNPRPMWVYDKATLAFLEVNEAAVVRYGYSREEFLSMSIADIRPPEDVERLLANVHRPDRASLEYAGVWRHLLRDGTVIDVEIRSHTLPFKGRPAALVVAEDVTERRRAEAMMRDAYERERESADRLRALDETKNGILQAVSHELRTPLAIVLGLALTIEERTGQLSPNATSELAGRLAVNARRLERLISGLLDLDRVTRGIMEPKREPTDVDELIRRVIHDADIREHAVEITGTPGIASIDPAKVERIIENLIVNASRHTPAGTHVRVSAERGEEGLLLVVEDSGPGVPEELKDVIFEPFRSGDTPEHSPGTGIGLSLVSQFAKLHGGRAWVEDRVGGGAAFKVLLPAA